MLLVIRLSDMISPLNLKIVIRKKAQRARNIEVEDVIVGFYVGIS